MSLRTHIERWAPGLLTVLLLLAPPVRYRVHWVDGPPQDMWGWPLPWSADGYVGSRVQDVYLLPLASAWAVGKAPERARLVLLVPTWLLGAPLLLLVAVMSLFLTLLAPELVRYHLWYSDWPVEGIEGPRLGRDGGG